MNKVLLNIPFQVEHDKLLWLINQFEKQVDENDNAKYEVIEETATNAGLWITEIDAAVIDKAEFVVVINDLLFFHQDFWQTVDKYISLGVTCFGCERILYSNKDMGLMDVLEHKNPRIAFFDKSLILGDILQLTKNYIELYHPKPLVASMLDDTQFIAKNGNFYKEILTAEMLNNGKW